MSLLLIDAFAASSPAPVLPPPPVFASAFAALVERVDRDVQFHLGGETVIYQPEFGAPVLVTGVYDEVYVLAKGNAEAGVSTLGPAVFLRLDDLPVDLKHDKPRITVRGVEYRVTAKEPDGIGGIVLALRKVT